MTHSVHEYKWVLDEIARARSIEDLICIEERTKSMDRFDGVISRALGRRFDALVEASPGQSEPSDG